MADDEEGSLARTMPEHVFGTVYELGIVGVSLAILWPHVI